jgi:hypothetical protein
MKWFENLFKKEEVSEDERLYRKYQNWIFWLTAGWLLATFQHNYSTLSKYNLGETLNLGWISAGLTLPIADISNFVMVVVLEITLFFSVSFIPAAKRWNIKAIVIYLAMIVSTAISIFLNVKYMVAASPTDSVIDVGIGAIVGGLIPTFVVIFGYIQGHVVDSRMGWTSSRANGGVTVEQVKSALDKDPYLTQRAAAARFGVSLGKMNKIYAQIREMI